MIIDTTWRIVPQNLPCVIRHCSKCNRKMSFYCSQKFRVNSNQLRADIWLIYKCSKCDTTWKLTLMRGIKPADLSADLFEKFTNNDADLAKKYAFDRQLLKQNDCKIDYSGVDYHVEGLEQLKISSHVSIQSEYFFDLKLSALLSNILNVSVSSIRKLVDDDAITTSLDCNIMKYRIRADFNLSIDTHKHPCIFP